MYPFDYEAAAFRAEHRDTPFFLYVGSARPPRAAVAFGNHEQPAGVEPVPYDPEKVIVPNFLPDVDHRPRHAIPRRQGVQLRQRPPLPSDCREPRAAHPRHAYMSWVDFCPTILEWCGVEHPEGEDAFPGRSLLPILADDCAHQGGGEWEETFFSHCFREVTNYYPYRVQRAWRYKYVLNLAHQLEVPLPSDLFRSLTCTAVRDDNLEELGKRSRDRFMQPDREALFDRKPTLASPGT